MASLRPSLSLWWPTAVAEHIIDWEVVESVLNWRRFMNCPNGQLDIATATLLLECGVLDLAPGGNYR